MKNPAVNLGTDVVTGRPVSIAPSLFERHAWIQGMTGARKSILAVKISMQPMTLLPNAAFVFCDLGGDQYAFNRLRMLAAQLARPFQFLSVNRDDDWDSLDPMAAITPLADLSVAASYLHSILVGDHGEGYGTGYYSRFALVSILRILMSFSAEGLHSPTLHDFAKRFAASKGKLSDQSEAQLAAEMMLTYEQVQPSGWGHKRINVSQAFEGGQVTYGFLPTLMHPGARMLASTLVFSFVLEAMRRHYAGLPVRPLFIVVDEYPAVANGKQWGDLLVLARKYHIHLIVLTQTCEQLRSRDRDMLPVLFDNTAIKIWLTPISVEDIETLRALSKDQLKQRGSTQALRGGVSSVSMHEVYESGLEANRVRDAAYSADQGFLITNAFQGYVEPIHFRFSPDLPLDEYLELSLRALPQRETIVPSKAGCRNDSEFTARQAAIDAVFALKQRQLNWEEES